MEKSKANFTHVILGIIPGIGHISVGRCLKGVVLFLFFVIFVNAVFVCRFTPRLDGSDEMVKGCIACALIIWAYSFLDVFKIAVWNKRPWIRPSKKKLFEEGMRHYLCDEFSQAKQKFQRILRLDDEDVDAHFLLGLAMMRLGNRRRAVRCFKRALSLDETRKWEWEVSEYLRDMLLDTSNQRI